MTSGNVHVGLLYGGLSSEHEVSIASARNVFAALDPAGSSVTATQADIAFTAVPADDPVYFDMPSMSAQIDDIEGDVTSVAYVGILEEHRFYVREIFDAAPNGTQDVAHRFSRARVFPGTDRPWRGRGDAAGVADMVAQQRTVPAGSASRQPSSSFISPEIRDMMLSKMIKSGRRTSIFWSSQSCPSSLSRGGMSSKSSRLSIINRRALFGSTSNHRQASAIRTVRGRCRSSPSPSGNDPPSAPLRSAPH